MFAALGSAFVIYVNDYSQDEAQAGRGCDMGRSAENQNKRSRSTLDFKNP